MIEVRRYGALWPSEVVGYHDSWGSAYAARDAWNEAALAAGYRLSQERYGIWVG